MEAPKLVTDKFLNPGEIHFGDFSFRLRTLLGSCVSIVLWHPTKKIGGMCHYLLPEPKIGESTSLTKYGIGAFLYFQKEILKYRLPFSEFQAKVFGGSHMFLQEEKGYYSHTETSLSIGDKNIQFAKTILEQNRIPIISWDVGGSSSRKLYFTVWDGEVWVEKQETNG